MAEMITSSQNPGIKNLILLQSKSRERKKQNIAVIEGYREISRALISGVELLILYFCPELVNSEKVLEIEESCPKLEKISVSVKVFERLAYREGSDGLIALIRPKYLKLAELNLSKYPLLIILESVEKPGNLGAVLRTADAAGVDAVIIGDPLTDLYNPNTIRSSVGCIFTRQIAVADSKEIMKWLLKNNVTTYAAALNREARNYDLFNYKGSTAFVMGTEATGLSPKWLEFCNSQVIIPMLGIADSLNVSVSTSILVYEAMRQRNFETVMMHSGKNHI
ncbi:MAG: RNA methyltransferase [Bacteroidetes bacterium]|nr:RNA methyltransferase [Bacteroidota bacterium]